MLFGFLNSDDTRGSYENSMLLMLGIFSVNLILSFLFCFTQRNSSGIEDTGE